MEATGKIWMNGELVDWADATIHVGTHGLHYGTGVFEGIRCYETPQGPAIFRLSDHMQRFLESAKLLYMEIPYSLEELNAAVRDTVSVNGLAECYVRPIGYVGYGELGVDPRDNPIDVAVMAWPWGAYLGEDSAKYGITAKVSSWKRVGPNTIPHVAKATGIYLNSMLATTEARRAGYDEAIMLTDDGMVADGPGESIFVVKNGKISTPDLSASILTGVTRDTVMQLAADLGYEVVERRIIRTELYLADEVFMTGTAAEIAPLRSVDDHLIGDPGPITREIQQAYNDCVRGRSERWAHWLDRVPARTEA
jgi:branched-chain amino acid aminotransferase